jgi:hypothetical protein
MGRYFKNGAVEQDPALAYVSTDMMVLAIIEPAHVEVVDPPAQD